jgi:hypothetical protein
MSGKASAALVKSNDPVTIFKPDDAPKGKPAKAEMPAKPTAAPTPVNAPPVPTTVPAPSVPVAATPAAPTATRSAPVAAPAKAPTPKTKQLDYVIAKQQAEPHIGHILGLAIYVEQRMNAGQSEKDATDEVLALYRQHAGGLLAEARANGTNVRVALQPYCERELPNVAARHTSYAV